MEKTVSSPSSNNTQRLVLLAGVGLILLGVAFSLWFMADQKQQQAIANQPTQEEQTALVLEAAALDQLDLGNNEVAIKMLTEVIHTMPRRSDAYYHRGVAYMNLEQYDEAIADFNIANEANPHTALPLTGRSSAHAALGKLDEAIADLDKAIHLEPGEAMLYANRGQLYHQQNELELAQRDLDLAVELEPEAVAARFNRGVLYYSLGQSEAAIKDFSKIIEIDPNHAPPYLNRGLIYVELGQNEAAQADLEQFITLSGNSKWTDIAKQTLADLAN